MEANDSIQSPKGSNSPHSEVKKNHIQSSVESDELSTPYLLSDEQLAEDEQYEAEDRERRYAEDYARREAWGDMYSDEYPGEYPD